MGNKVHRTAIGLEYDGTAYKGFQKQRNTTRTIQNLVDQSLSNVADHKIKTICCGRTDSGVHAFSQIIHFDTTSYREDKAWVEGGNSFLPKDIRLLWAKKVTDRFHARFSAISRTYRYIIKCSSSPSALNRNRHLWINEDLDLRSMKRASLYLLGEKDFTSFRTSSCQSKTPFRNIYSIKIKKKGELIFVDITANAFLLNMVRIIVGTLLEVGLKRKKPNEIKMILEAKDRKLAGKTSSPKGLYLVGASYLNKFKLPNITNFPM